MNVKTALFQGLDNDSPVPVMPFIAPLASFLHECLRLFKAYCLERRLREVLVEGGLAALVVAVFYFGHTLLMGMAVLWCLTMLSIAGFRLTVCLQNREEVVAETVSADVDASDTYMVELAESLT